MITREQARQLVVSGRAAGLSDSQIQASIASANARQAAAQQAPAQQAQPARQFAPAQPSLVSRLANGLDSVQAAGNAFTNALTLGSLDRINAGIDNLAGVDSTVASNRAQRQALAKTNPVASGLGTLAGVIAPAVATGGGSAAAQAGANTARVAPTALRVAGINAAQGAAFDPASDENTDFIQAGVRARNAALGGGLGATINKAGAGLGNLSNRAGELAVKFLKPTKKEVGNIQTLFGSTAEFGKNLLNSNVFKGSVFGGQKKVLENLSKLETAKGKQVGNILRSTIAIAKKNNVSPKQINVNLKKIVDQSKKELEGQDLFAVAGGAKEVNRILDTFLDNVAPKAKPSKIVDQFSNPVTSATNRSKGLLEANKIRQDLGNQLFRNKKDLEKIGPFSKQIQETVQRNLKNAIDTTVDKLTSRIVGKEKVFTGAKKSLSEIKKAKQVLKENVKAQATNNTLGLRQTAIGGLGALEVGRQAIQGDVGGAAQVGLGAAALAALLSPRSTAARAQLLNTVGRNTQGLGNALQNSSAVSGINRLFLNNQ